jgi:hypothetical protein
LLALDELERFEIAQDSDDLLLPGRIGWRAARVGGSLANLPSRQGLLLQQLKHECGQLAE